MLALAHRRKTGLGQYIDISLFDTSLYLSAPYVTEFNASGIIAGKFGSHLPLWSPTACSWRGIGNSSSACPTMQCSPNSSRHWEGLNSRTRVSAATHRENPVEPRVERFLGASSPPRTRKAWVDLCVKLGVPTSLVRTWARWPATSGRGSRALYRQRPGRPAHVGTPFKMSRTPGQIAQAAAGPGRGPPNIIRDPSQP